MSAPTEPSATASEPRLPGRSSSWTRSRYERTRTLSHSACGPAFWAMSACAKWGHSPSKLGAHPPEGQGDRRFSMGPQVRPRRGLGLRVVSQISRDEVAHLARLARLALTDDELDSYAGQLDAILGHVSQI